MLLDTTINRRIDNTTNKSDSNLKSIAKTISWRIVGTIDTILIAYFVTGEVAMALSIGSVEVVSKMILYYLHERAWANVKLRK
ncbi:DUF2061 domain-containing protein [Roseivirga sp. E12]|uniref:DUF2061 domain-containing protein n=1 Tax=Roseivirga sp. E12 TaxID=2819237 RepID=UPI001ABC1862|nr:DUF2061 domain-containing protein [Roseivirga sp. E12]MBO3700144.1 DUF2061 domain-containing protein [Roseivirga sp. E12]